MLQVNSIGPWAYRKDSDDVRTIRSATGETLFCDETYYPSCSTNEADWPLVAAAPDLLAACRELYQILLDGMTTDYDDMTTALGKARAAIAKAEGT